MPVRKRSAAEQPAADARKRRRVQIQVCRPDGCTLEFKCYGEDDVATVKRVIAKRWQIPRSCLKLVHEAALIHDSDDIGKFCSGLENTVDFSAIVTVENLCTQLGAKVDSRLKLKMLKDLRKLGSRGADAIDPVCSCLHVTFLDLRSSALATLKQITTTHTQAIDSIVNSYSRWVPPTRYSLRRGLDWAVKVLSVFAGSESDNKFAVAAIVSMIERVSAFRKKFCTAVLRGIARDQLHATDMLLSALVKQDAVLESEALSKAEDVLGIFVASCFYDREMKLITKTPAILVRMVATMSCFLEVSDEKTQQNVLLLLPNFGIPFFFKYPSEWIHEAQRYYGKLLTIITSLMHDHASSCNLVEAALGALASLVFECDGELSVRIVRLLDSSVQELINRSAFEVLRKCAEGGNASVSIAKTALLTSSRSKIKAAALKVLSKFTDCQHDDDGINP